MQLQIDKDVITFINIHTYHEFVFIYMECIKPCYPDSNGCGGLYGVDEGGNNEESNPNFVKEDNEGSEENFNGDVDADDDSEGTKFKDRSYDEN